MQIDIIAAQPHIFISVPVGALVEAGIKPGDAIEIYAKDNKVILQKIDSEGFVCDEDCDHCPLNIAQCMSRDEDERNACYE